MSFGSLRLGPFGGESGLAVFPPGWAVLHVMKAKEPELRRVLENAVSCQDGTCGGVCQGAIPPPPMLLRAPYVQDETFPNCSLALNCPPC